jgi:hypothetical protein
MAVIEITCPHCNARTYVTFVRQTGNGSCPECGNEIKDVFQYSNKTVSGEGSLLTEVFNPSGATFVSGAAEDGQDLFGDNVPIESLPEVDTGSMPLQGSAPALDPSLSGPALMPLQSSPLLEPSNSGPSLVPVESAPMLAPSNSAPSLMPSNTSVEGKVEGMLLTPPPPRLRQFATESSSSSLGPPAHEEINLEEISFEERPVVVTSDEAPTNPTLPPVPVSVPIRASQTRAAVRKSTGSVSAVKPATGVVAKERPAKPLTATVVKPATRRPTAAVAPTAPLAPVRKPTSSLPPRPAVARRPTAQVVAPRKSTGPIPKVQDDLAPAEEFSLLAPPMRNEARKPTSSLAKGPARTAPQTSPESGGRSYAPIRVPGPSTPPSVTRPPSPPKRPTAKLSVVGLGDAPRLTPPEKPKDFGKPKFDPGLTRLGYTMPGSDVSHFDGLPEPSAVPFGSTLDDNLGEEPTAPPTPPGPRPGTRAAMPRPSAPVPKEAPLEDYDVMAEEPGVDVPAAAVSKVEINEDWAPGGPNSGIVERIDIPDELGDGVDDSAATTVPEIDEGGDDEVLEDEFEAQAPTRQLPQQEKHPRKAPAKARPVADEESRPVYASRPHFDWETFRYRAFVGIIYTVCALALLAFVAGLYHVHVSPLF